MSARSYELNMNSFLWLTWASGFHQVPWSDTVKWRQTLLVGPVHCWMQAASKDRPVIYIDSCFLPQSSVHQTKLLSIYLVYKFFWLFMGNLNFVHILFWPIPKEGKSLRHWIQSTQGAANDWNAASMSRNYKRSDQSKSQKIGPLQWGKGDYYVESWTGQRRDGF